MHCADRYTGVCMYKNNAFVRPYHKLMMHLMFYIFHSEIYYIPKKHKNLKFDMKKGISPFLCIVNSIIPSD